MTATSTNEYVVRGRRDVVRVLVLCILITSHIAVLTDSFRCALACAQSGNSPTCAFSFHLEVLEDVISTNEYIVVRAGRDVVRVQVLCTY